MSDHSGDESDTDFNDRNKVSNGKSALTEHCGIRAHAHECEATERAIQADLADKDLLGPAQGGIPSAAKMIKDVNTSRIPGVVGDSYHDAAVFKATIQNEKNHEKRLHLLLRAWTKIYSILSASCKRTCPSLHEEMYQLCEMTSRGYPGGVYDGPLAYRMYMASLQPAERTKEDREYYDAVLAFMKTNHLPENCTGAQYLDKAMAFIIHVFKHVARPYTNDLAGEELVGFMPLCLSSDSRRLLAEFRTNKLLGDPKCLQDLFPKPAPDVPSKMYRFSILLQLLSKRLMSLNYYQIM